MEKMYKKVKGFKLYLNKWCLRYCEVPCFIIFKGFFKRDFLKFSYFITFYFINILNDTTLTKIRKKNLHIPNIVITGKARQYHNNIEAKKKKKFCREKKFSQPKHRKWSMLLTVIKKYIIKIIYWQLLLKFPKWLY